MMKSTISLENTTSYNKRWSLKELKKHNNEESTNSKLLHQDKEITNLMRKHLEEVSNELKIEVTDGRT